MEVHEWSDVRKDETFKLKTETVRQGLKKKSMKDRESRQGGRQAYHLCVGGHKLKEEKKMKKGSKIKREEAERKEGEEKRKESGQRVKWISGCFNLKNRTEGNQKHLTWYKSIIQRKMLLRCRYEWRSNVADLWGRGQDRNLTDKGPYYQNMSTKSFCNT